MAPKSKNVPKNWTLHHEDLESKGQIWYTVLPRIGRYIREAKGE